MLVFDSNGKEVKWNFAKYYQRKNRENKSKGHTLALSLLKELFPNSTVYEEVSLPTDPVTYADLFLPDIRLIVEVQGVQHYEYNPHFHKDKLSFYKAKARDKKKQNWCKLNNIKLVELPDKETDKWRSLIVNCLQ